MPIKLSPIEINALEMIRRYGELLLDGEGFFRSVDMHHAGVPRARVEKLARRGLCQVDVVGGSTFVRWIDEAASALPTRQR